MTSFSPITILPGRMGDVFKVTLLTTSAVLNNTEGIRIV